MSDRLTVALFATILVGAVAGWLFGGFGMPTDPLKSLGIEVRAATDPAALTDDDLRKRAQTADCATASPLWWAIVARHPDDLEAYKALALCGRRDNIDGVVDDATRAFEESKMLGVVPEFLDMVRLRERVPILNRVQAESGSEASRLRQLGSLRRDLGDVEGAVQTLGQALALDPTDVESGIQLGYALVDGGRIPEARMAFQQALANEGPALRMTRLYAMGVAWPLPFSGVVIGIVGLAATFATRPAAGAKPDRSLLLWGVFAIIALAGWFTLTADRIGFLLLVLLAALATIWLLLWPLRDPLLAFARRAGGALGGLTLGQVNPVLARLPVRFQAAVLFGSVVVFLLVVPRLQNIDLRLLSGFFFAMLAFTTVGSLLLNLVNQSGSLRVALRWLGVAGTLPFLLVFLYFERESIGSALISRSFVDGESQDRLAAYALVWFAGFGSSIVLARILAGSILGPVEQLTATVAKVREGDFEARSGIVREDELGDLAEAVDAMAKTLSEREHLTQTFKRYMNPGIAERLLAGDDTVRHGQLVHATVLFSDVRGFTSLSERLSPTDVVDVLNEYFARMEPIVRRNGGVVDKFLGDGMLAVWDVPEPLSEGPLFGIPGAKLAVEAALQMVEALTAFNEELAMRGLAALEIGIGINTGELIAGPVGSRDRQEYTVIGDTVNTAQRVESHARFGATILITEPVRAVVDPFVTTTALEPISLKGKRELAALFQVVSRR